MQYLNHRLKNYGACLAVHRVTRADVACQARSAKCVTIVLVSARQSNVCVFSSSCGGDCAFPTAVLAIQALEEERNRLVSWVMEPTSCRTSRWRVEVSSASRGVFLPRHELAIFAAPSSGPRA